MKSIEENKYYIWLSSIENLSAIQKINLLNKFTNPQNVFQDYYKNKETETMPKYMKMLENKMISMKKQNIKIITIEDEEYPQKLKDIYDYPIVLYCKGNIELARIEPKISIIGCREYSEYGKKISFKFAYELSRSGITIVSGGARGIDSFSHRGCVYAKKGTIAILGNGLDYIYPPENKELEEEIIKNNGLLMSEYIIGRRPTKYTFPARNRLISALSDGVLVVEAKEKSGTIITVDFALEQGKTVYAVPGNIDQVNSYGTNNLIKQGAKLVMKAGDIIEDFIY